MTIAEGQCALRLALGERQACPGASCQLWHRGACVLESVRPELASSPELARHLLDLQGALERAASADEQARAHSLFHRLLNDEQAAGA